ncbi:MAG: hypothetical protein KC684_00800 [Candidatus Omnitrophica bacterium]|nr:hypothetical protein [Candidatus Omnitrophota bacterium]
MTSCLAAASPQLTGGKGNMEEQNNAILKIKGKEYRLKLTVGFWKQVKELCDVTQENLQSRIEEDFGNVMPKLLRVAIYWGLTDKPDSFDELPVTERDIEEELDQSCVDVLEEAIVNGMTKAQKKVLELAKKKQDVEYANLEEEISTGSKKKD